MCRTGPRRTRTIFIKGRARDATVRFTAIRTCQTDVIVYTRFSYDRFSCFFNGPRHSFLTPRYLSGNSVCTIREKVKVSAFKRPAITDGVESFSNSYFVKRKTKNQYLSNGISCTIVIERKKKKKDQTTFRTFSVPIRVVHSDNWITYFIETREIVTLCFITLFIFTFLSLFSNPHRKQDISKTRLSYNVCFVSRPKTTDEIIK